jgi:ribosomal protein S3
MEVKRLINKLIYFLFKEYIDRRNYVIMHLYLILNEEDRDINVYGITRIQVERNTLTITLTRPGIFIGKAGNHYEAVKQVLSARLGEPISIKIKESKLWNYTSIELNKY